MPFLRFMFIVLICAVWFAVAYRICVVLGIFPDHAFRVVFKNAAWAIGVLGFFWRANAWFLGGKFA